MCLLASLLFWTAIKLSKDYDTIETIGINYELPQGLAFAQAPPNSLEARVRATGWELVNQGLSNHERMITIDSLELQENSDGIISIRSEVANAFEDEGLDVNPITNERIVIQMERVASKMVPLRLTSRIEYARGFQSSKAPRLDPDSVTISGPISVIDSIFFWMTDSLILTEVIDTVRISTPLKETSISSMTVRPTAVSVAIESQQFTEKSIYVPVEIKGATKKDSISVFPKQVLLKVAVGLHDYETIKAADFKAVVSIDQARSEISNSLPVILEKRPDLVRQVSVQPQTVEVFFYEKY
jgi:hypothetical protein